MSRSLKSAPLRLGWLIRIGARSRLGGDMAARLAFRAMAGPASELRSAVGSLREAAGILEALFLKLGGTLQQLASRSDELVQRSQSMVRMATGQETGNADFARTMSLLAAPLVYLESAQTEMGSLADDLRSSMNTVKRLLTSEQALARAIAPLRSMQAMFSIESAGLSEESRQIFAGLTRGIGLLHEKVQVSFGEHFRTLSETYACLRETVDSLDRQSHEQVSDLRDKHAQIDRSLACLSEEIAHNQVRDVQLTNASAQLAAEVNRAVVGLQAGDMVSQKLTHAQAGLEDALNAIANCQTGGLPALQKVPTLARMEAAQMDAVVREMEHGEATVRNAVQGITGQLQQIDSEGLMLREFKEITASVNGTVQVLLDCLAGVRELVKTMLALTARTEDMIRPVGTAAASLTSAVEGVANEMRLIALNAQIQAIQIGRGTGLEVLAARTSEISDGITELGARIAADLADTAETVGRDIARLARMREQGDGEMASLTVQGAIEETSLHGFRDQMLAEVQRVGQVLEEAQRIGAEMLASIDLGPVASRISDVREHVAGLVEASAPLERAFSGDAAAHAASLKSRYTMASERDVHRDILQELGHVETPEAEAAAPAPVEDALDGVEMF